jgi:hypothetical protein
MQGLAFYEAAAQVIPVLILVLVIEFRMSDVWPYLPRYMRFMTFAILAFCVIAEFRAFRVLYVEDATFVDPWLVGGTMFSLGLSIIAASTGNPFVQPKKLPKVDDLSERVEKLRREVEDA